MGVTKLDPLQSGLPSAKPTASFWHTEPCSPLIGFRSSEKLPTEVDTVIVGAGMTGAFAAREMMSEGGPMGGVVILEAREICWGATGRNGGHCQPGVYYQPPPIARFELATFDFFSELISQNDIQCEWKELKGVHVMQTPALVEAAKNRLATMEKHHPDLRRLVRVVSDETDDGREELRRLRVSEGARGAVVQEKAAMCWPYKLVTWVIQSVAEEYPAILYGDGKVTGFNIQTNTPVTALQKLNGGAYAWVVHTPRGQIMAKKVLLAANAYVSYLLKEFTGLVVPTRGQVAALRPPQNGVQLESSYGWLDNAGGDNYLIHWESKDGKKPGELILGGERFRPKGHEIGIWQDDEINPLISQNLATALSETILLKDSGAEDVELGVNMEWTGIMGFSKDDFPWVGKVPESLGGGEGLWICGGYTGHGMPVAARCGIAIAQRMSGKVRSEKERVNVPDEYKVTEERVMRVRGMGHGENIVELLRKLDREDEMREQA